MTAAKQLSAEELADGLDHIFKSPQDEGRLELIVRRPDVDRREALEEGRLDVEQGLVGDNWLAKGSRHMPDGSADPDMQLNIMNSRVIALVAQHKERWHLAGDQLFIDLDLSAENLPPGSRLAIGTSVIEVTAKPHTGCQKFVERYGADAMKFVNSAVGRRLHLRGINAKVIEAGVIRVGDTVTKR